MRISTERVTPSVAAGSQGQSPSSLARASSDGPSRFANLLQHIGRRVDAGEALVQRSLQGGATGLSAEQLIVLQAGIYRYSEAVELASKLVDRATSAVKTVLQPH